MALTSPDNIWTPDSSDNYALTTDLAATADSVQDAITALRGNNAPTVRVANVAERNAALADHGTPTTSNPLIVFRADAGAGRELEYTTNGTVWRTLVAEEDTGWVDLTLTNGWSVQSGRSPQVRRLNGVVYMQGHVTGGSDTLIANLPNGFLGPSITHIVPNYDSVATFFQISSSGGVSTATGGVGRPTSLVHSWVEQD